MLAARARVTCVHCAAAGTPQQGGSQPPPAAALPPLPSTRTRRQQAHTVPVFFPDLLAQNAVAGLPPLEHLQRASEIRNVACAVFVKSCKQLSRKPGADARSFAVWLVAAAADGGADDDSGEHAGAPRTYRWQRNILAGLERTPREELRASNNPQPPPSSAASRQLPQSQGREVHVMSPGSAVLATLTVRS
jgi:hypothetical protein